MKEETTKSAKQLLFELSNQYPLIADFTLEFHGSGDSFDDYHVTDINQRHDLVGIDVRLAAEQENALVQPNDLVSEIMWLFIEEDMDVDFNNEGGGGKMVFDLEKLSITYYSYYNEMQQHWKDGEDLEVSDDDIAEFLNENPD
jgi:hypothetical protein